jgi:dTDP-4-amino-4,6-dideoxygalactose transaminase
MTGKKVKFLDLKSENATILDELKSSVLSEVENSDFILGNTLSEFEKQYSSYCSTKYTVGVGSGSAALLLSLLAVGVSKGDEIILPSYSFIATALSAIWCGAVPVLVDCTQDYLIDTSKIEEKITNKTRAIIPVHLFGQMADMEMIRKIAKKHSLAVIEDAAQSHGARRNNISAGSFGDAACFSFYPSKNLGCFGDGGAVVTNKKNISDKIAKLRNYGSRRKYDCEIVGYNERLDSLQAAVLKAKLNYLDNWNKMRQRKAKLYKQFLSKIPGITIPQILKGNSHVYHIFPVNVTQRDKLSNYLLKNGVETLIHYPIPIHLQKSLAQYGYKKGDFPVTEKLSKTELSLPIYPTLDDTQIEYVCELIKKFYLK